VAPSGAVSTAPGTVFDDPLLGREVAGKYRIVKRLGSGGMGAVYQARHLETGGDVALKVLHGTALGDESAIRRFRLEAQNAAALRHVNTIRVIDFGVDAGLFYLVLEYLDGRPLADLLLSEGPLPWRRAVHITRQVLKSLWEAHEHEKRIVHRDIKPGNIYVVDLAGENDHVKVLDFGISRALDGSGASTIGIIGTPFYMAPELWRGEPIDARTDLYALGCVVYQMLAGHPPFVPPPSATESLYPLLSMHLHEPPPPLASVAPELPRSICAWVDSLLAKEPSRRPASARTALDSLEQAVVVADDPAGQALTPHAPAPPRPARPSKPAEPARPARSPGPPVADTLEAKPRPSPVPLWLWLIMGALLLSAIIAVIAANNAGNDPALGDFAQTQAAAPSGVAASAPPAYDSELGNLAFYYRARLSEQDHRDPSGGKLYAPAAVLARDRIRFHAGLGDPEDGADPVAHDPNLQAELEATFDEHLDPRSRIAILEGQPLVEVSVYEEGLRIRVLAR